MLNQLFQSVISQSTVSTSGWGLVLSLLTSMVLGLALAYLYQHKTSYSRETQIGSLAYRARPRRKKSLDSLFIKTVGKLTV
ncbi:MULTISPECIES: hypothetical protein [unclassified Streptococcus]|uniref:hypothetical protein n=1 Tax=unclassified Streptococcus TaxID=2608887 RepID=UPI00359E000B